MGTEDKTTITQVCCKANNESSCWRVKKRLELCSAAAVIDTNPPVCQSVLFARLQNSKSACLFSKARQGVNGAFLL